MLLASTSTNGGLTWSTPVLVNPPTDKAAFTGTIAVDRKGRVGVTYYDFTPPLTTPDILLTDTWFTSTSGPGLDFGPRRLIGGPYNMEAAPIARGFFVGDYEGLAARIGREASGPSSSIGQDNGEGSAGFVPLFVMTNCKDNSCRAQFHWTALLSALTRPTPLPTSHPRTNSNQRRRGRAQVARPRDTFRFRRLKGKVT